MLYWLVCGTVFTHSNRVVREYVKHRDLHQRTQANCSPAVVAEDEESRAKWPNLRQRQAVQDSSHRVLTDAEMEVSTGMVLGTKIAGTFKRKPCLAGRAEIR